MASRSHSYQLEGAIALLSPDEITPTAARMLQSIADQWRKEAFEAFIVAEQMREADRG